MANVKTEPVSEVEAESKSASAPLVVRVLLKIWESLFLFGALLLFGIGGLIFTAVSSVLYPILPRNTGARLGRRTMQKLFRFFVWVLETSGLVRCDLEAIDSLRDEKGLIIAPNHPSLLDAVLVISRLPDAVCIMKAKIWHNPILGGGSRLAGYLRNDTPKRMVRDGAAELKNGHQLLVFPEGTRTRRDEGPVNEFKGGFALIAREASAPVQTIILESNTRFLEKGWPVFRKPVFPLHYRARLGRRFEPPAPGANVRPFVAGLESAFAAELAPADSVKKETPHSGLDRATPLTPAGPIEIAR